MLAQGQHLPNLVKSEKAVLHTCCDIAEENLKICRDRFSPENVSTDFREAVADPEVDAICLATTERMRLPVIRAAADAGKPLFTEKPLASTLEEAYQIRDVVKSSGIPFCVGHNRRCSPAMAESHRIFREHMENPRPCPWRYDREGPNRARIKEDGVGAMSVRINDDWYSWKAYAFDSENYSHGPMLWEGTHFVDVCNWFMAAEPETVVAQETGLFNHAIVIRYRTGEMATISMSANGSFGYPKELYEATGQGGIVVNDHMVEIRTAGIEGAPPRLTFPLLNDPYPDLETEGGLSEWLEKRRRASADAVAAGDNSRILVAEPEKGHARMLDAFVDEIRGERGPVCDVDAAVLATRVCIAAVTSAREKRFVELGEI
jgi:predicted dehydrogenase